MVNDARNSFIDSGRFVRMFITANQRFQLQIHERTTTISFDVDNTGNAPHATRQTCIEKRHAHTNTEMTNERALSNAANCHLSF